MTNKKWTIVTGRNPEQKEEVVLLYKAPIALINSVEDLVSTKIAEIKAARAKMNLPPYTDVQISELTQEEAVEKGLIERIQAIIFN